MRTAQEHKLAQCKQKKRRKKVKKIKYLEKHSHATTSTWIKTRRQISTWNRFKLQNGNIKIHKKDNK